MSGGNRKLTAGGKNVCVGEEGREQGCQTGVGLSDRCRAISYSGILTRGGGQLPVMDEPRKELQTRSETFPTGFRAATGSWQGKSGLEDRLFIVLTQKHSRSGAAHGVCSPSLPRYGSKAAALWASL